LPKIRTKKQDPPSLIQHIAPEELDNRSACAFLLLTSRLSCKGGEISYVKLDVWELHCRWKSRNCFVQERCDFLRKVWFGTLCALRVLRDISSLGYFFQRTTV
jgi:hypothetical protein